MILKLFLVFLVGLVNAEFEADIRWTCSEDKVAIFVRTPQPFDGILTTRMGNSSSQSVPEYCKVQGFGTNVAVLKLSLNSEECGIMYNKETRTHWVQVDIHSHPVLIVEGDKSKNITCRDTSNDTSFLENHNDSPVSDYELRLLSSRLPVDTVKYSRPYTIQIRPFNAKHGGEFFVGQCTAQPIGGNVTVQLTDSVGCALFKSIMGDFGRREFVEEAEIPSMFRFPDAKQLKISCVVTECEGICEKRTCESDSSASLLLERTTASIESEDVQKAWIVVNIEENQQSVEKQPVKKIYESPPTPPNIIVHKQREESLKRECVSEFEFRILYYLCIFLAICSIVGFTMNIVLCLLLKRRSNQKARNMSTISYPEHQNQLKIPKSATNHPDFWIKEPTNYFTQRRDSTESYASVRKQNRQQLRANQSDYGRGSSATSSADSNEIYRRPHQLPLHRPEVRHSNSTFVTHSTTMETDLDSQGSSSTNHATSYH